MTPEGRQKLKTLLINQEKYEQFPYTDITGHLTIGIGRNLTDRGISLNEALLLVENDIQYFTTKLDNLIGCFRDLSDNRKIVLVNMCFNLGVRGIMCFTKMLDFLAQGEYGLASEEIINSKAAHQCVERYKRLAEIMRTDIL
jgi:lysozyme